MITEPQSRIILCNVPWENNYEHQLTFDDVSKQQAFFNGIKKIQFDNYTFIRENSEIIVDSQIDNIINYNYLYYTNAPISNKTYYCFITNVRYINEHAVGIKIETDIFQTFMWQIQYNRCFVEREHVNDDTIGSHTYPEGLETGEYIVNGIIDGVNENKYFAQKCIVLASTVHINATNPSSSSLADTGISMYGGIPCGWKYYFYENTQAGYQLLLDTMAVLENNGKIDAVVGLFVGSIPICPHDETGEITEGFTLTGGLDWDTYSGDKPIMKPTTLDTYTPKNNKLFTYPYCYLYMTNNSGGEAIYKYELFQSPTSPNKCDFSIYGTICPGMSTILYPHYYGGGGSGNIPTYKNALIGAKFPVGGWQNDIYTNWLTQNSVNTTLKIGSGIMQTVGGALMLTAPDPTVTTQTGGLLTLSGGLSSILSAVGEVYQHSLFPAESGGNINNGDVMSSLGKTTFTAVHMTIKYEYLKIIDEFFSMYGYKICEVKVPNIKGRQNWNYVKLINSNVSGDIPQIYLDKINASLNKGVTFWHNYQTILDYSQDNPIV